MLSSSSVISRFTPPTCTLEIWSKNVALSSWIKQKNPEEIRFQLHFDDPRLPQEKQVTVEGDRAKLEQIHQAVNKYVKDFLRLSSPSEYKSLSQQANQSTTVTETQPHLQPQGLVAHELWLGSLAEGISDFKINLSTVQLFDLAAALNQYHQTTLASGKLNAAKQKKIVTLWGSVVGATVLAVSLATVGINIFNQSRTNPTANQSELEDPSASDKVIPDVIAPQITRTTERPVVQPKLTEPLSSTEKLPPPPPVDLPKAPPPNVPDPAKYPFPEPSTLAISQPSPPQPSQSTIAIKPSSSNSSPQTTNNLAPTPPKTPSSSSSNSIQIETNNTGDDIFSPELPPPVASLPEAASEKTLPQTNASTTDEPSQEIARLEGINPSLAQNPQVQEVKEYFQKQWQPPEGLKQTLEYRLVLNGNGSIQRIIPLGKASEIYLDRTGIPLMGESFVSPNREAKNLTVRLLLGPDREVKTFLE